LPAVYKEDAVVVRISLESYLSVVPLAHKNVNLSQKTVLLESESMVLFHLTRL